MTRQPLLADLFDAAATHFSGRPALRTPSGTTTFRQLQTRAHRLASSWRGSVVEGDAVAVQADDPTEFVASCFAVLRCGGFVIPSFPIDGQATPRGNDRRSVGCSAIVQRGAVHRVAAAPAWTASMDRAPAFILFTSGTTGSPIPVVHTHESLMWCVWNTSTVMDEVLGVRSVVPKTADELYADLERRMRDDAFGLLAFYTGMPFHSIAGLSVLLRALTSGHTLVTGSGAFNIDELMSLLVRGEITSMGLAPAMVRVLERRLRITAPFKSGLFALGVGGAAAVPEVLSRVEQQLGCVATVGYGSTEAGGVVAMTRTTDPIGARLGTVGRSVGSVEIRLEPKAEDSNARLLCRTRAAMAGSVLDGTLLPPPEWLDLGDLADMDSTGNLRILGRADFMISRGGRRIDPVTLEHILEEHDSIHVAVVLGLPSRVEGEEDIGALIVAEPAVDQRELRRHFAARADGLTLRRIRVVESLPTLADGEIRRAGLADQLRR